ncbi:MAG: hypothetical protein IPK63_01320 [Candidatus Competibacteraceae bacterium]|nr:hypothetical protein [Candidatus Competibacteraceae bacterium]
MSHSLDYKQTQFGTVVVVSLLLTGLLLVGLGLALSDRVIIVGGPLLTAVAVLLFHSLTIVIDADYLRFWFGVGLIQKRIPLAEIREAKPVRNSVIHGWGIHRTAEGWVYNVSGWEAVEITLANGKRLRLGTPQPNLLARKLRPGSRAASGQAS